MKDLLQRPPITLTYPPNAFFNEVVLVTGAAGSVGSELCAQLLRFPLAKLICLDCAETPLFDLEWQCLDVAENTLPATTVQVTYELCDLRNSETTTKVFEKHKPTIVFHAAAYKHVPMLERNPEESILNNIKPMRTLLQLVENGFTHTFVLISTDKVVNPTSVMGMSKSICEYLVQGFAQTSRKKMMVVRFGNVLESNGSVIPIFRRQIAKGGPVTVTDARMKRFFMTRPEAAQLLILTAVTGQNNSLYLLEMGPQYSVLELAKLMIGDKPIEVVMIGSRPGERFEERLVKPREEQIQGPDPLVFEIKRPFVSSRIIFICANRILESNHPRDTLKQMTSYLDELVIQ